jgi:hypothetical protein
MTILQRLGPANRRGFDDIVVSVQAIHAANVVLYLIHQLRRYLLIFFAIATRKFRWALEPQFGTFTDTI